MNVLGRAPPLLSVEIEEIFALRPLHPLLEVLFPHGRPGPAIEVLEAVLDRSARNKRGRCRFSDRRDPYQAAFLRMIPPFRVRISQNLSPL